MNMIISASDFVYLGELYTRKGNGRCYRLANPGPEWKMSKYKRISRVQYDQSLKECKKALGIAA